MNSDSDWEGDNGKGVTTKVTPQTLAQFHTIVQAKTGMKKKRTIDSEEEEEIYFSSESAYPGKWLFKLFSPGSPSDARIRVQRIYWNSWNSAVCSILFTGFGLIFLILGFFGILVLHDVPRGASIVFVGVLLCMPGLYSMYTLLMYVCGYQNYSYHQLPGQY